MTNRSAVPPLEAEPQAIDAALLPSAVSAVRSAGARLLECYSAGARPTGSEDIANAARANELASVGALRTILTDARPLAGWVEDTQETTQLPDGEWWAVDAVEGNVNHIHGLPEWCVSATLIRDNVPTLAAIYQPIGELTYTAVCGQGAHVNGQRLRTSSKTDLAWAIATTGQAEARQADTYRRIGDSIAAVLNSALLVRATVPSTFPLMLVAAGHADLFWQYTPVLAGVAAGALLVTEAGGVVSDVRGRPWRPGSPDFLASAPGVHAAAIRTLSGVETS